MLFRFKKKKTFFLLIICISVIIIFGVVIHKSRSSCSDQQLTNCDLVYLRDSLHRDSVFLDIQSGRIIKPSFLKNLKDTNRGLVFSYDRRKIAYTSNSDGNLYIIDIPTQIVTKVSREGEPNTDEFWGNTVLSPEFSPDNNYIAYRLSNNASLIGSDRPLTGVEQNRKFREIQEGSWFMKIDGSNKQFIAKDDSDIHFWNWTLDNKILRLKQKVEDSTLLGESIDVYDPWTGHAQDVFPFRVYGIEWSRSSSIGAGWTSHEDILIFDKSLKVIRELNGYDYVSLSPDGKYLLVEKAIEEADPYHENDSQVYLWNIHNAHLEELAIQLNYKSSIYWSRDNRVLIYTKYGRDGKWGVFTYNLFFKKESQLPVGKFTEMLWF